MKRTKRIISLLLTIQMLLACTFIPGVMATDVVVEAPVIEWESFEELSPMMASECSYYISGKPYVPEGANLIREEENYNKSAGFASFASSQGYVLGTWMYKMETWGTMWEIFECHYWYNTSYPDVFFYHN